MFLAAMQSFPKELYEAAVIDGATWVQSVRHVTVPLLKPTVTFIGILRTMEALGIFPIIYIVTAGGPAAATETVNFYAYVSGFSYLKVGYASAIIVVFFFYALADSRTYDAFPAAQFSSRFIAHEAPIEYYNDKPLRHRHTMYGLAILGPIAWILLLALKNALDAFAYPPLLIFEPTFEHFIAIFQDPEFRLAFCQQCHYHFNRLSRSGHGISQFRRHLP